MKPSRRKEKRKFPMICRKEERGKRNRPDAGPSATSEEKKKREGRPCDLALEDDQEEKTGFGSHHKGRRPPSSDGSQGEGKRSQFAKKGREGLRKLPSNDSRL